MLAAQALPPQLHLSRQPHQGDADLQAILQFGTEIIYSAKLQQAESVQLALSVLEQVQHGPLHGHLYRSTCSHQQQVHFSLSSRTAL